MPTTLPIRNVHAALPAFLLTLLETSISEESRNGPVFVYPYPLTTLYERPWERVIFWEERDANPFFHFQESLWMLAGRNDVDFPAHYAKQLRTYSDDGKTLHGAYGHRWRHHFADKDQLSWAISRLRDNPSDRRTVISMWDPIIDADMADKGGKDTPCNTQIYLNVRDGHLCMQVNCRSNDALLGAFGANAVHMAFLHEYLAAHIGVPMGWYAQNSFNIHVYEGFYKTVMNDRKARVEQQSLRFAMTQPGEHRWNPYSDLPGLQLHSLVNSPQATWDSELAIFLAGGSSKADGLDDPFFTKVAVPIRDAHAAYRKRDHDLANEVISKCAAADWRRGCTDWLTRRAEQRNTPKHAEPDSAHP